MNVRSSTMATACVWMPVWVCWLTWEGRWVGIGSAEGGEEEEEREKRRWVAGEEGSEGKREREEEEGERSERYRYSQPGMFCLALVQALPDPRPQLGRSRPPCMCMGHGGSRRRHPSLPGTAP